MLNKRPKICIGLPTMSSVDTLLMTVILTWMAEAYKGGEFDLTIMPTINEQPVDNARNHIVQEFLKSDATHLFFIDSDTIPPLDALKRLIAHDRPIISAVTPIIELNDETGEYYRKWNCVGMDDKHMSPNTGTRQCKGAGSSCILIKREVFEKLEMPYYRFVYTDDAGKSVVVSEDIYFIINCLSKGIETYADTSIICRHKKSAIW